MDYIIQEIELLLQILINRKKNYIQQLKTSPPGGLIRATQRKRLVYMHSFPDGICPSGQIRYRRKVLTDGSDLLKKLVLKEYLKVSLKIIDHNIKCLQRARAGLQPLSFETVRAKMGKPYRSVPDSILAMGFLTNDARLPQHEWAARPYNQSTYKPEEKTFFTSRGLAMRSRAELLIAEMLYQYDIPFRYEQVVRMGKYELAPDFTFLDRDGNEFYWEYCGMMSSPTYRDHQIWRRRMYEGAGITEWDNGMIYTYDAFDSIDMREIKAIIETKILPRM